MQGFLYRTAIRIKEAGERWRIGWLVRLGLNMRDKVLLWKN
ncbi:MAG: hypothetical protein P1P67_11310 [Treponema phagedenis]